MLRTIDHKALNYKNAVSVMETLHDSFNVRFYIKTFRNGLWSVKCTHKSFGEREFREMNFVDAVRKAAIFIKSSLKLKA